MSLSKLIAKVVVFVGLLFGSAGSVYAFDSRIEISNLPEWTRTNDLEISYSALTDGGVNVHFCYKKEGESYKKFGPNFTTPSGEIQITGSQMSDQMVKHYFKAVLNGSDCSGSVTDETSTIYDYSQPSSVTNLKKEYKGNGYYRLTWTNPHDPDFMKVIIYKSESPSFTADGTTRVGETGGAYNTEVSWDIYGLDPNKKFYFAVRALDKAGNASGAVGDSETVVVLGTVAPTLAPEEKAVSLPKVSPTPTPKKVLAESTDEQAVSGNKVLTDKVAESKDADKDNGKSALSAISETVKGSVGIKVALSIAIIIGIVFLVYALAKKQSSTI